MPRRRDRTATADVDVDNAVDPEIAALAAESLGDLRFVPGRFEWLPIDKLEPHPKNPNEGDLGALSVSVKQLGFYGVVYVTQPNDAGVHRIVAGEHRWLELKRLGSPSVPCWVLEVDEDWATRALLADNRVNRLGRDRTRDLVDVLRELAGGDDGLPPGYDGDDLDALLRDLEEPVAPPPPPPRSEPEEPVPTVDVVSVAGDVWQLGPHRLIVGDCFVEETLEELLQGEHVDLVLTDPPFAIYGSSTGVASDVADDKMVRPFFARLGVVARARVRAFGHVYVHCDWRSYPALYDGLREAGLAPKNLIVWDKGRPGLGSNYTNTHEFVAYFASQPPRGAMSGSVPKGQRAVSASNIYRTDRVMGDEREHNAAKPVDLLAWLIRNSSDAGALVLDLFAGSGSTLIAAHREGRRAALVEITPGYADVTCRRWQRETGELPARASGAHDFLAG